jgi:hypothetical protein
MQQSLRLACLWMIVWPFIAFALALFDHSWMIFAAAPGSSMMIYWSLRSAHGGDIKKWWWLWRGPHVMMREGVTRDEAIAWLDECMPGRWNNVYPYVVKFKNKSDATAFKLMWG